MTNTALASPNTPLDPPIDLLSPTSAGSTARRAPRWPALTVSWYIGIFCLVAGGAVAWSIASGNSTLAENNTVILAVGLRLITVGMALASVVAIGRLVPAWMLLAGLWGAAAVQVAYPVAETVFKALILTGVVDPIDKGISNMSAEGWFNFASVWVIWGIPGILFALAAVSYRRRVTVRDRWVVLGVLGGAAFLFGLGALIG